MAEPVSLELAKMQTNAGDAEDALLNICIASARGWVENYTGQILTPRRITVALDSFNDPLLIWPVAAIYTVSYNAIDRSQYVLSPDVYGLANVRRPARLTLKGGQSWPRIAGGPGQVIVEADAGYAAPEDIPPGLLRAMLLLIGGYYADRETGGLAGEVESAARFACGAASRGWRI